MKRLALALLWLFLLVFAARAQCFTPGYSTYAAPVVVNKTVVEQVLIATPLLVPVYSTGYVPPPVAPPAAPVAPAPAQPPAANNNDQVLEALKAINRRLDALEKAQQGGVPEPVQPPPAAPAAGRRDAAGLAILKARCASCHTDGRLFAGLGHTTTFVLFKADGSPAPLSAAQKFKALQTCRNGSMPVRQGPGGLTPEPLKDEEYAAVEEYLHSV